MWISLHAPLGSYVLRPILEEVEFVHVPHCELHRINLDTLLEQPGSLVEPSDEGGRGEADGAVQRVAGVGPGVELGEGQELLDGRVVQDDGLDEQVLEGLVHRGVVVEAEALVQGFFEDQVEGGGVELLEVADHEGEELRGDRGEVVVF